MRHLFIANPHSFRKSSNQLRQVLADIEDCFPDTNNTDYKVHMSRYPRDAMAVIHRYMAEVEAGEPVRVYAVGGDGIIFDCVNGIVGFQNVELTVIPYGSANDFARSFGMKAINDFRNIKKLINAPSRSVDIINCGSNYAINEVAFGIESQAVMNANSIFRNPYLKFLRGNAGLVYQLGAISSIINEEVRRQMYRIIVDGEEMSGCYCNISVSNTPCIGGTMFSCPYAKPNDGVLDAVFAAGGGVLAVLGSIGNYTNGRFEKNKTFFRKQFRKMEVKSDTPIRVHMDGESFFANEVKLEVIPSHIQFFSPDGIDFEDYSYKAYKTPNKANNDGVFDEK